MRDTGEMHAQLLGFAAGLTTKYLMGHTDACFSLVIDGGDGDEIRLTHHVQLE